MLTRRKFRRRYVLMIVILSLVATVLSTDALAHGPCGETCLEPNSGPPGTYVTTEDLEGILAVWNPRPNMLPLGVPGTSKTCDIRCAQAKPIYHVDQSISVLAESERREQLRFDVPVVPPGEYLVVIYDGSENGYHYTYETFKVTAGSGSDTRHEPATAFSPWLLAAGMLLTGLAAGWVIGKRSAPSSMVN
jgi:hypothetical protein